MAYHFTNIGIDAPYPRIRSVPSHLAMTRNILLLAACLAVASGETLCNNSLFQVPTQWGASSSGWGQSLSSVKQSASPVPPPSKVSAVCKYYAKQPEVCCSADTLDAIE